MGSPPRQYRTIVEDSGDWRTTRSHSVRVQQEHRRRIHWHTGDRGAVDQRGHERVAIHEGQLAGRRVVEGNRPKALSSERDASPERRWRRGGRRSGHAAHAGIAPTPARNRAARATTTPARTRGGQSSTAVIGRGSPDVEGSKQDGLDPEAPRCRVRHPVAMNIASLHRSSDAAASCA
jgi:hypothetical protein